MYDELEEIEDPENLRGNLSEDEEYWARAMIGKAAWLMTSVRADLTGDVSILQQEMTNDKRKDIIPKVNSLIRKALDHRGLMLTNKYMLKPHLIMYTDASYDSNTGNSQLGYMLITKEEDEYRCNVLTWGSRKNARKNCKLHRHRNPCVLDRNRQVRLCTLDFLGVGYGETGKRRKTYGRQLQRLHDH